MTEYVGYTFIVGQGMHVLEHDDELVNPVNIASRNASILGL